MEWQKGITTLIAAGKKRRCALKWAFKGWEVTELAMGNQSSLHQSKIRSSGELPGGEVGEVRLVIKGLSNKMRGRTQHTRSLGFKLLSFTVSGVFGTHSSRRSTSFQLRGQIHNLCPKLQHLPSVLQESSFCTLNFCAFANRE